MRESRNAEVIHGHHIWGRGRSHATFITGDNGLQGWIPSRANNGDGQSAADEEDAESNVNHLEGALNVGSRTLRFSGDHRDVFRTNDGEARGPEGSQKALKATKGPGIKIFQERARVVEVAEAVRVMFRVPTNHRDEGEEEQGEDQDNLAAGKPEFSFTVRFDGQNVDGAERRV